MRICLESALTADLPAGAADEFRASYQPEDGKADRLDNTTQRVG